MSTHPKDQSGEVNFKEDFEKAVSEANSRVKPVAEEQPTTGVRNASNHVKFVSDEESEKACKKVVERHSDLLWRLAKDEEIEKLKAQCDEAIRTCAELSRLVALNVKSVDVAELEDLRGKLAEYEKDGYVTATEVRLRNELAEAQKLNENGSKKWDELDKQCYEFQVKLAAANAKLLKCREALKKYGIHRLECQMQYIDGKCTCGLAEALSPPSESSTEKPHVSLTELEEKK
jgi:hypothetical protein